MAITKIMVVEDELLTAMNIKTVLESEGHKITATVSSGPEALEAVRKDVPDVVIMDIKLDGPIDGITTAKAISGSYHIPIIYLTQFASDIVIRATEETHPIDFIKKPFTDTALIRAVEMAVRRQAATSIVHSTSSALPMTMQDAFLLTNSGERKRIFFKDIVYINASRMYTKIYIQASGTLVPECILVSRSSNKVVSQLPYWLIIRVHRSYYVNIKKIASIRDHSLIINGSAIPIPIGGKFRQAVYDRLAFIRQNPK